MAGNAVIGALRAVLGIDTAQFEDGLKGAQSKLSGFGKAAVIGFGAVGAAATAMGAAVAVGVQSALKDADEMGKLAQKIGVSVEELTRLRYAAELSDVSAEELGTSLGKLSKNMAAVASGSGAEARKAFEALGVSVLDAGGHMKSSTEVMREVAGKFGGMQDGASKTAIAMALFGRAGADLIPLLNAGADGIKEMEAEADQLGLTISAQTAAAAETFNDNLTRLGKVMYGITTRVTAGLAPTLADLSNRFVQAAQDERFMAAVTGTLDVALKALGSTGVILGAVFTATFETIKGVIDAAKLAMKGDFGGAGAILNRQVLDVGKVAAQVKSIWAGTGATSAAMAPAVSEKIAAPMMQAAEKVKKAAKETKKAADDLTDAMRELLADRARWIAQATEEARGFTLPKLELVIAPKIDPDLTLQPVQALEVKLKKSAEEIQREFEDAVNAIGAGFDQIFYGLRDRNWMAAVSGLLNAIKAVKAAQGTLGTAGAIGAVAGAAAPIVGGVGGSVLGGVAAGAQLGSMFPVVGTAIGAVVGGIGGLLGGLFGGSSAKKKAKAEAAARAAAEAQAKAEQVAAEKRSLEIQIMELQGQTAEALAARRADELAAMDESNRALAQQAYTLQDKAEADRLAAAAAQKAAELETGRRELEIQLMEAQGKASEALAASRQLELEATDESLRGLKQAVFAAQDRAARVAEADQRAADAREAAVEALRSEGGRLEAVRDQFRGFAEDIDAVARSLALSSGTGSGSLAALARQFDQVATAAQLGDTAAMGQFREVAQAFKAASDKGARNALEAARNDAKIRVAAERTAAVATRQADLAQGQLDGINATVSALGLVNESVLSVRDALAALAGALGAQAQLGGSTQNLGGNPTVNALLASATGYGGDFGAGGFQSFITGASAQQQAAARAILTTMGQADRIVGFATGGSFQVGGPGGVDSVLTQMRTTPGEYVSVSRADPVSTVADLAGRMQRLEVRMEQVVLNTGKAGRALDKAMRFGIPVRALDPAQPITVTVAA